MDGSPIDPTPQPTRRRVLGAALGAAGVAGVGALLAGCGGSTPLDGKAATGTTVAPPTAAPDTAAPGTAPSTTVPASGPARFVSSGPNAASRVALTFHTSGDLAIAQRLLDVLAAHGGVPITAFVVGQWLEQNPTWARKIVDAGHELANHTYSHPDFGALSEADMASEVGRCRDLLQRLAGSPGRYFRPSGTADGTATPSAAVLDVAGRSGYGTVLGFDVDPFDYQDPAASVVVSRTLNGVASGSVVSLHFDHVHTVDALPAILNGLDQRGLQPVTASKLLSG